MRAIESTVEVIFLRCCYEVFGSHVVSENRCKLRFTCLIWLWRKKPGSLFFHLCLGFALPPFHTNSINHLSPFCCQISAMSMVYFGTNWCVSYGDCYLLHYDSLYFTLWVALLTLKILSKMNSTLTEHE